MAKTEYDNMDAKERAFALFTACEEAWRNGYDGKEDHEAALACWNAWAEPLLAEREKFEADGEWAVENKIDREVGKNNKTRNFLARANIDASSLAFVKRGWKDPDKGNGLIISTFRWLARFPAVCLHQMASNVAKGLIKTMWRRLPRFVVLP